MASFDAARRFGRLVGRDFESAGDDGDKVSTGDGSRAELQLDFANILRLGSNFEGEHRQPHAEEHSDSTGARARDLYRFRRTAKRSRRSIRRTSRFIPRIMMEYSGSKFGPMATRIVIVRQGEAQIATPQGSTEVQQGEMATIRGIAGLGAVQNLFCSGARRLGPLEQRPRSHHPERAVRGSIPIAITLDRRIWMLTASGRTCLTMAKCGYPNEPDDWAPYRDGNWIYEPYYGWTWVGYEPGDGRLITTGAGSCYGGGWAMVAGTGMGCGILSSVLVAGVCVVLGMGRRIWIRFWLRRMGRIRLAAARAV